MRYLLPLFIALVGCQAPYVIDNPAIGPTIRSSESKVATNSSPIVRFYYSNKISDYRVESSCGSGVIFKWKNQLWVATAAHVVNGAGVVELKNNNREIIQCDIGRLIIDKNSDIAVARIFNLKTSINPYVFDGTTFSAGDSVRAVGYPLDGEFKSSDGIIEKVDVRSDAYVNHGMSGGPVFVGDRLVGIISGYTNQYDEDGKILKRGSSFSNLVDMLNKIN